MKSSLASSPISYLFEQWLILVADLEISFNYVQVLLPMQIYITMIFLKHLKINTEDG